MKDPNYGTLDFAVSFNPTTAFPIDNRCYFESLTEAQAAAASAEAAGSSNTRYYEGQTIAVVENNVATLYIIENKALKEVGSKVEIDENQFLFDATTKKLNLYGFASAVAGAQLTKGADGKLSWVKPDTTTVEGLSTAVKALQDTVYGPSEVTHEATAEEAAAFNAEHAAEIEAGTITAMQKGDTVVDREADPDSGLVNKVTAVETTIGEATVKDEAGNVTSEGTGLIKRIEDLEADDASNGTAAKADVATVDIGSENEDENALPTVGQVEDYVDDKLDRFTNAFVYVGKNKVDVDSEGNVTPIEGYTPVAGDVTFVNDKEYVYDGANWEELGDEGSHATKTELEHAIEEVEDKIPTGALADKDKVSENDLDDDLKDKISAHTKVEASENNGYVKVDDEDVLVYDDSDLAGKIGEGKVEEVSHEATQEDVDAGKAENIGDKVVDTPAADGTGLTGRIEELEEKVQDLEDKDLTVDDEAVDGQFVTSVAQDADGKITVSRAGIDATQVKMSADEDANTVAEEIGVKGGLITEDVELPMGEFARQLTSLDQLDANTTYIYTDGNGVQYMFTTPESYDETQEYMIPIYDPETGEQLPEYALIAGTNRVTTTTEPRICETHDSGQHFTEKVIGEGDGAGLVKVVLNEESTGLYKEIEDATKGAIENLDSSAVIASEEDNIVKIKTTVEEVDGLIDNGTNEITLAKVAKTGLIDDLSQAEVITLFGGNASGWTE